MDRATKFVCPHCNTSFRSAAGMEVGKKARCPYCSGRFVIRADDERPAQPATAQGGQVNANRLGVAVFCVLLYLLGGAALGVYCFALNAESYQSSLIAARAAQEDEPKPPDPPKPKQKATVPVAPEEQRKIDDQIVKGVWYLKKCPIPATTEGVPGSVEVGVRSLAALTLLECGVPASDPVVQQAAKLVRQEAPPMQTSRDTYQIALALFFLDRLEETQDQERIQFLALRLLASQRTDDGGWGYSCPSLNPGDRAANQKLLAQLRDNKESLDQWHVAALNGKAFTPERSDNSNTQFAALALWVARHHDVDIDKAIALVDKRFSASMDGDWWYSEGDNTKIVGMWPSMTCAGLVGLAVAHGVTPDAAKKKALDSPPIPKALSLLAGAIGENKEMDLYFLWSLERVAVLYTLAKIDGKDWYAWGCSSILPSQAPDGAWNGEFLTGGSPIVATCFALLFLKQANLAQDLSDKLDLIK